MPASHRHRQAGRLCSPEVLALQPSLPAALEAQAGAGDETRTRDVLLGKEVLYH
jgi:hypothetical protein